MEGGYDENEEDRAKADVYYSCIISTRTFLIKVFERLLKTDIEYFIDESERRMLIIRLSDAGREIGMQFSTTYNAIQVANALNTMMAGLKKYHDVMLAISKNIPIQNKTIQENVSLIEANGSKLKDILTPESKNKLQNECTGGKTYGFLQMAGETIEKKMVKYFEFMDVIYKEIKK